MNITFDLATVLVAGAALAVGCRVYWWMAPAAGTASASATTKAERLVAAIAAAAAVVTIGVFLISGIRVAESPSGGPAPGPTATRIGSAP